MPNSSKIAFIFHGEAKSSPNDKTPLEYLSDDVQKMRKALEHNWTIVEKDEKKLKRSFFNNLHSYKDDKVKDVLFYFTGHGIDHEDNILDEYTLKLSDDETQNITTKELVAYLNDKLQPTTLTIILDTCYSGQAEIETGNNNNIQILTSSNYIQPSYESWGVEGGLFTHFFCRAIESACGTDETGKITLGDIAEDIRKPLKKQGQDIVSKSIDIGELSHLAMAYNKEVWEIRTTIQEKFSTREFKSKLLEYIDRDDLGFKEILKSKDFNELLTLALKHKKSSLSCIFQELGIKNSYLEKFSKEGCQELKERAKHNREVQKVILRISQDTSGGLKKCMVEGWFLTNIDTTEALGVEEIDFTSDYILSLSKYIKEPLEGRKLAKNPLALDLILDDGLMTYDFYPLSCEKYGFRTTIQFLNRNSKAESVWEENSDFFLNNSSKKIGDYIYEIEEEYEKSMIDSCFEDDKIVIDSKHNLLSTRYIEMIKNFGLPFVFTPTSDVPTEVDFSWKDKKLKDLRLKGCMALKKHYNQVVNHKKDGEKNIQFIYDSYHDMIKFKTLIQDREEKIR